jgi:hypothetical protein
MSTPGALGVSRNQSAKSRVSVQAEVAVRALRVILKMIVWRAPQTTCGALLIGSLLPLVDGEDARRVLARERRRIALRDSHSRDRFTSIFSITWSAHPAAERPPHSHKLLAHQLQGARMTRDAKCAAAHDV